MTMTDAYYPFSPNVLSTLRRTITSIKLNLDLPPASAPFNAQDHSQYSISELEQQFDHKLPNLFPNLTHITISDDHAKPYHNVTKTLMDAIVRNFPALKSVCFSMPNIYRFSSYNAGTRVEEVRRGLFIAVSPPLAANTFCLRFALLPSWRTSRPILSSTSSTSPILSVSISTASK